MIGPTIEETTQFIIQAHGEQTRRGDEVLYYTHPVKVAEYAKAISEAIGLTDDQIFDAQIVALLHDTVEDTPVTYQMLGKMGYSIQNINSVYLVTREEGETFSESINEIIASRDLVATIVKTADTLHNSQITPEDVEWGNLNGRNVYKDAERYSKAHKRLMEHLFTLDEVKEAVKLKLLSMNPDKYEMLLASNEKAQDFFAENPEMKEAFFALLQGNTSLQETEE